MTKTYLKRIAAPRTWPITRRTTTFITRPKPSGSPLDWTLSVGLIMKEFLKLVETTRQAGRVLKEQEILVNGRRVYNPSDSAGFMDLVTAQGATHRVLLNANNVLTLAPVGAKEAFRVAKVLAKTTQRGGTQQLNLQGGANIIVEKSPVKVGDSVALSDGKIAHHYPLAQGASVFITGGDHIATVGTIEKIEGQTVTVRGPTATFRTLRAFTYVVGTGHPAITITG